MDFPFCGMCLLFGWHAVKHAPAMSHYQATNGARKPMKLNNIRHSCILLYVDLGDTHMHNDIRMGAEWRSWYNCHMHIAIINFA